MNINNIPNDKRDAEIALKHRVLGISELIDSADVAGIEISDEFRALMAAEVHLIGEIMYGDEYEADARADHRTDI